MPTSFAQSANRRHCLACASKLEPRAAAKSTAPSEPTTSRSTNCAVADAADTAATASAPTPTPSKSARVVSAPRTYEQRPCAVSQDWNAR